MFSGFRNVKKLLGCRHSYDEWQHQCEALLYSSWWRHQMETSSASLAFCAGNSPVIGEFPSQRPVTRSFDVFFDLHINGWLNNREAGDLKRHRAHYDLIVITEAARGRELYYGGLTLSTVRDEVNTGTQITLICSCAHDTRNIILMFLHYVYYI